MVAIVETRRSAAPTIADAEKLRRWAAAYARRVAPKRILIQTEYDGTCAFEGWRLGRGADGYSSWGCGGRWRRSEAIIYLTSGGRVVCNHSIVSLWRRAVASWFAEYESDLELLRPMGVDQREDACESVLKAARAAARKCEVFGVFSVTWVG